MEQDQDLDKQTPSPKTGSQRPQSFFRILHLLLFENLHHRHDRCRRNHTYLGYKHRHTHTQMLNYMGTFLLSKLREYSSFYLPRIFFFVHVQANFFPVFFLFLPFISVYYDSCVVRTYLTTEMATTNDNHYYSMSYGLLLDEDERIFQFFSSLFHLDCLEEQKDTK